ncbi:MAG: DUF1156 domain-containing protein [Chloroflexota bacterium]
MPLETNFDAGFAASQALREKQIQQNYRPIIGIHKWFARRPGSLFRSLLLAEYDGDAPAEESFFRAHSLTGVIADPFMGGGTPLVEANRLGFHVLGVDVNPMAWWIVHQELAECDDHALARAADHVIGDVQTSIGDFYATRCLECGSTATAKYFLWVKTQDCPGCGLSNDLFPGYLLADDSRHPRHVLACSACSRLVEVDELPSAGSPARCPYCNGPVRLEGPARRNRIDCRACRHTFKYPDGQGAPKHRLWAIEYHCEPCKPSHEGRFFKVPDQEDLAKFTAARTRFSELESELSVPADEIPAGDETNRLLRWGYRRYRDMFNDRQLLGLGLLRRSITSIKERPVREALLTVFSDTLRYQNMLCRYDTYALKCQDIFSVHGFPVGLVQCENNLLGIPKVGSGGYAHFVEKYRRAKQYCVAPFETSYRRGRKQVVRTVGEHIGARLVSDFPTGNVRVAQLIRGSATDHILAPESLDGVFTDPPYFANVQYAELMDFCYVWLRPMVANEHPEFQPTTTRTMLELTGNETLGRDLVHFASGLSGVFCRFAAALKQGAPFVFTYHHNQLEAYEPLILALLDARLHCCTVLPAPAEMSASLHINKTDSSILDSVFVCRHSAGPLSQLPISNIRTLLVQDLQEMRRGGVHPTLGDAKCLLSGYLAAFTVERLNENWNSDLPARARLARVHRMVLELALQAQQSSLPKWALQEAARPTDAPVTQLRFEIEVPATAAV